MISQNADIIVIRFQELAQKVFLYFVCSS